MKRYIILIIALLLILTGCSSDGKSITDLNTSVVELKEELKSVNNNYMTLLNKFEELENQINTLTKGDDVLVVSDVEPTNLENDSSEKLETEAEYIFNGDKDLIVEQNGKIYQVKDFFSSRMNTAVNDMIFVKDEEVYLEWSKWHDIEKENILRKLNAVLNGFYVITSNDNPNIEGTFDIGWNDSKGEMYDKNNVLYKKSAIHEGLNNIPTHEFQYKSNVSNNEVVYSILSEYESSYSWSNDFIITPESIYSTGNISINEWAKYQGHKIEVYYNDEFDKWIIKLIK